MPNWAGRWKGGRYYLDDAGKPVFFIERKRRVVKLKTRDPELALGELARFLEDPDAFTRAPPPAPDVRPVYVTSDRIKAYLRSIADAVADHRNARDSYLRAWGNYRDANGKPLDLRSADRKALRVALASFDGGHRGRAEALNAFARFLVREEELPAWRPVVADQPPDPETARAERRAYSLEELRDGWAKLSDGRIRDVFLIRCATGLHQTEIDQLAGARLTKGPLPDQGAAVRELKGDHEIAGVLQVFHKSKHRHRVSVTRAVLDAALRLRAEGVPRRTSVWKLFPKGIVPSNLRHTFETLAEDAARIVTHTGEGVPRSLVAQVMGHRAGSTMIADRYNQTQIPPMIVLPLGFP